ncbi:hypothetical protein CRYUN_Cryun01aG0222100 [Craigia yunnanensis]
MILLSLNKIKMPKLSGLGKLGTWKNVHRTIFILGTCALLVSVATLSRSYSIRSLLVTDSFCNHVNPENPSRSEGEVRVNFDAVIQKLRQEMKELRGMSKESSSSEILLRHNAFLADILGLIESMQASLTSNRQQNIENKAVHPLGQAKQIRKQNFMGANGTFTSIGHACFATKKELEEYMDYDVGEICNDDWKLAQRLMVHGCDPLPRRRCLARAPQLYSQPFPINESLWKLPDDRNVRWSGYRCKNFTCLANNSTRKGFFKCADCFNLSDNEMPRWIKPVDLEPETNLTADFLIPQVLDIKPGEIRIGLDFSVGTGTFAARMREFNVTIVSATVNLGAPFNEMIALRGLFPLYLTINQRLPFFDNTLDLIHTTRFLDGWIDLEDLDDYLEAFKVLRYRKHKWIVVPKRDKDDREVFFSAVLEKPPRPFR